MAMQTSDYQIFANQSPNTGGYRCFFNGQEADNEVFGEVANFGYEFRQYDSRLGRWWSVDPKAREYPDISPYAFSGDNPILFIEKNGKDFVVSIDNQSANKTITIQLNIYTTSEEAYSKINPAVDELNSLTKSVTINDVSYTLSFNIQVLEPDASIQKDIQNNLSSEQFMISNAYNKAKLDEMGNVFLGTIDRVNTTQKSNIQTIIGGKSTGKAFWMQTGPDNVQFINYPDLISHEILHLLGLSDKGGKYYAEGGRMEYTATLANGFKMNLISNADIKNILQYSLDNNGVETGKADVRIEYLNNSTPISSDSNIEVK